MFQAGSAVPLYTGTAQPTMDSSFAPPLRDPRFPNSVWPPSSDPNGTFIFTN